MINRLLDLHAHEESCRAVRFVNSGQGDIILLICSYVVYFIFVIKVLIFFLPMDLYSNADGFNWPFNSGHGCGDWSHYCSSWGFSWVSSHIYFLRPFFSSNYWSLMVQEIWFWCSDMLSICRDAIYSLINVTESTVASGDDQGCIKVVFFPSSCYETGFFPFLSLWKP